MFLNKRLARLIVILSLLLPLVAGLPLPGARAAAQPPSNLPSAAPVAGRGSKLGIAATGKWPGETTREWGRPIAMDDAVRKRVDAIWSELGL